MTHSPNTDGRSKWLSESTTLNVNNREQLVKSSVKIYPNPEKGNFTIAFKNVKRQ